MTKKDFIAKVKLTIKKGANWLASNEGQTVILAASLGMCAGAFLANKQDAKACGLTYGQLMQKIRNSK